MASSQPVLNRRNVDNIGLFYVCYRLARLGWNVAPTSATARGVDLLVCGQDAAHSCSVQVKSLSRIGPVLLGPRLNEVRGDFVVICRRLVRDVPECFVLTPEDVGRLAEPVEQNGRTRFWLNPEKYDADEYRNRWDRIAGILDS